jgi:hypothetical protein
MTIQGDTAKPGARSEAQATLGIPRQGQMNEVRYA